MSVNKKYNVIIETRQDFLNSCDNILIPIIMNSPEFKKLADRTQVIFNDNLNSASSGNMVHNRQTHTMVVSEISYRLAKHFGLGEFEQKMARLIGLCHDIGHTSLGHTGESRIDEALQFYRISSRDFDRAYRAKYDKNILQDDEEPFKEGEHSFEHHAHSTRVLRKILDDNHVYIADELIDDLEMGILFHSESRSKVNLEKPLYVIPRIADKTYAFTDIYDIICSENDIPRNIFEKIQKDEDTIKYLGKRGIELNEQDSDDISALLASFENAPKEVLDTLLSEYVNTANLDSGGGKSYKITSDGKILRHMRILQAIVKYLRRTKVVGKEEELANAMVDEIISYKINDFMTKKGMKQKEAVIEASIFVSELTDTELRKFYRVVSADKEWVKAFDSKMADENYKGFEIKILPEERKMMRNNPNIILNYYFDKEIKLIEDDEVKRKLMRELIDYKSHPSLELRRELIEKIEEAKAGGNSHSKRNNFGGPGGEDR